MATFEMSCRHALVDVPIIEEFECCGEIWVVHTRHPGFSVSHKATGFGVGLNHGPCDTVELARENGKKRIQKVPVEKLKLKIAEAMLIKVRLASGETKY